MSEEMDTNILWEAFREWAEENDISLEHPDDWTPWWGCYLSGASNWFLLRLKAEESK